LEQLLAILEIEYDILRKGDFTYFQENYLKSMYRFNEKAKYLIDDEEKTCIIKGLDRFGQLILEDAKGNLKSYGYKELKFL
jgi:biotin-(acetyl-CoA carboxylase) ligase